MARIGWVDSARSDPGLTCVISEQHASSGLLSQRSTSKFRSNARGYLGLGDQETG
jgi:hypothetical protein